MEGGGAYDFKKEEFKPLNSVLFSKQFLLSLAAISVLSSFANAIQVSGSNCIQNSSGDNTNCTVNTTSSAQIKVQNQGTTNATITIGENGKLNGRAQGMIIGGGDSGKLTINNQGSITTTNLGAVYLNTQKADFEINNKGLIQANGNAINPTAISLQDNSTSLNTINNKGTIGNISNAGTINTINNSGTINTVSVGGSGYIGNINNTGTIADIQVRRSGDRIAVANIINGSDDDKDAFISKGILIETAGTVGKIKNYGTISKNEYYGYTYAINVDSRSSVEEIYNKGTLDAQDSNAQTATAGIKTGLGVSIGTINNENEGVIKGLAGIWIANSSTLTSTSVGTINNKGLIKGGEVGVLIQGVNTAAEAVNNEGTIEGLAGIWVNSSASIETINNKGTIRGGEAGIYIQKNNNQLNITNSGLIHSDTQAGIQFNSPAGQIHITQTDGSITGKTSAIDIQTGLNHSINIQGGVVEATQGAAISTGTNTHFDTISLNGEIISHSSAKTNDISALINKGTITSLIISENAKIQGNITNDTTGTISNGIINNSTKADISISNTGFIGTNTDGNHLSTGKDSKTIVTQWRVKNNNFTFNTNANAKIEFIKGAIKLQLQDAVAGNVNLDDIIICKQDNKTCLPFDESGNQNTLDELISGGKISLTDSQNNKVDILDNPAQWSNAIANNFTQNLEEGAYILTQSLSSLLHTRSFFVDSVMSNAVLNTSAKDDFISEKELRYANMPLDTSVFKEQDKLDNAFNGFVLPYFNSTSINAPTQNKLKNSGHTLGVLAGGHYFHSSGVYGVYLGYEKTDLSSNSIYSPTRYDINALYFGLKHSRALAEYDKNLIFVKGHIKAAYNQIQGNMTLFGSSNISSKANLKTSAYGYLAELGVGDVYTPYENTIITPELTLAYTGGFTQAFDMKFDNDLSAYLAKTKSNFFHTQTSIKWYQAWLPQKIATSLEGGARYIFNPKLKNTTTISGIQNITPTTSSRSYEIENLYAYAQAGLIFKLEKNVNFSINYNAIFADKTKSHTGFLRVDYLW